MGAGQCLDTAPLSLMSDILRNGFGHGWMRLKALEEGFQRVFGSCTNGAIGQTLAMALDPLPAPRGFALAMDVLQGLAEVHNT